MNRWTFLHSLSCRSSILFLSACINLAPVQDGSFFVKHHVALSEFKGDTRSLRSKIIRVLANEYNYFEVRPVRKSREQRAWNPSLFLVQFLIAHWVARFVRLPLTGKKEKKKIDPRGSQGLYRGSARSLPAISSLFFFLFFLFCYFFLLNLWSQDSVNLKWQSSQRFYKTIRFIE